MLTRNLIDNQVCGHAQVLFHDIGDVVEVDRVVTERGGFPVLAGEVLLVVGVDEALVFVVSNVIIFVIVDIEEFVDSIGVAFGRSN